MTPNQTSKRIHPIMAAAGVSVILVSLVGVAAMTGILPNSYSTTTSAAPPTSSTVTNPDSSTIIEPTKSAATSVTAPVTQHHVTTAHKTPAPRQHSYANTNEPVMVAQAKQICTNCGTVESVNAIEQQPEHGSGIGAVAGALLGGALGNQVGSGNGRKLSTLAGAIGGGFAGNAVEKRTHTNTIYQVRVRMEDGSTRTFTPAGQPGWSTGDHVKVVNGNLTSEG